MAVMGPAAQDRRIQARVPVQLQVNVLSDGGVRTLLTGDLNRNGVFIRTDNPNPIRELVDLELTLGEGGETIRTLAVVRHRAEPDK